MNHSTDPFAGLSEQGEVRQVSNERDRPVGHPAVLRQHRAGQHHVHQPAHGGQTDCSILQDHEDP